MTLRHPSTRDRPHVDASRQRVEVTVGVRTLLLIAGVAAIVAALVLIHDALLVVFTAIFFAFVCEIPVRLLSRATGMKRSLAAAVVVLGSVILVTALALVLLVPMVDSLIDFLKALPQTVQDLRNSSELSWLKDSGSAENVQQGADHVASTIPTAIGAFLGVAGSAFSVGLTIFTLIFIALFLLMDIPRLQGALSSVLMPRDSEYALSLWDQIAHTVSRWALGAAFIAVIAGTVQGGAAWILGSQYALALGLIAGFLDLIPTIGATIAGFILVPTILAEEGLTSALIMLAVVLVYQQVENNLLTPTVQGKAVDISGFFIIVAVTLFGALLGVLGALTAVPLAATIQIFIQELTKARREKVAEARAATPPSSDPASATTP